MARGDPLVCKMEHFISFEYEIRRGLRRPCLSQSIRAEIKAVLLSFRSHVPSMSWYTARGRLEEYVRLLLWPFSTVEV